MRIAHVCLRYPPATGGVENYVRDIVTQTRALDDPVTGTPLYDARVLTSRLAKHHPASELPPEMLVDDPPYVQRLHHLSTPGFGYPRLQALSYYLAHHQPQIIAAYSYWYQPADVAARYAHRHRLPFIFHPMYYHNAIRQKWRRQIYDRWLGRVTFALADATVVISPFEQEQIEKAGYQVKNYHLIPPGIDLSRYDHKRLNPYLKLGWHGRVLLTVSRLAAGKGLADLIKDLPIIQREIADLQLVIIGEDFGAKQSLTTLAQASPLSDRIHFLGRVSDADLPAYYQHADLLVHPSHYEAFGIVLAESLAAGTPVVARQAAAIPFVAPHERGGLLFSRSDQLAPYVVKILSDQRLRQHLSRSGHQHIAANFSLPGQIQKITDLYRSLIAPKIA